MLFIPFIYITVEKKWITSISTNEDNKFKFVSFLEMNNLIFYEDFVQNRWSRLFFKSCCQNLYWPYTSLTTERNYDSLPTEWIPMRISIVGYFIHKCMLLNSITEFFMKLLFLHTVNQSISHSLYQSVSHWCNRFLYGWLSIFLQSWGKNEKLRFGEKKC